MDRRNFIKTGSLATLGGQTGYASMVEGMDKSLGDLMDFLEKNNIADNTVIIFMSDNGGQCISPQKGGKLLTHNEPLRYGKGSVYEGGIREPMIVKWPGVTKAKSRTEQPVIIEDFFPSILEIAGVNKYTVPQPIDGISFVPVLKNPAKSMNPDRALVCHRAETLARRSQLSWALTPLSSPFQGFGSAR